MRALFITHPEVVVDGAVPVPQWRLSAAGLRRMRTFAASDATTGVGEIWSSAEVKAQEAAAILAQARGAPIHTCENLGENDRSSTGFRPPAEFERLADAFFARPEQSIEGWERAVDAERRIAQAFAAILSAGRGAGDLAIVSHGGVGTLLYCHLTGRPIDRGHDQPFQGCYWLWDAAQREMIHGWRPIAPREG